jgi:hypothetical protein
MIRPMTRDYVETGETVEALEQRVRRLEDAVAALQDTQLMEDRVVERVRQRLELPYDGPPAGLFASAARMLLPKTVEEVPPDDAPATPAGDATANGAAGSTEAQKPGWVIMDLARELRLMLRMFADYRYRLSWSGRMVPLIAVVIAVVAYVLFDDRMFILGDLINAVINAVLVVIVYKTLSREAQRYRGLIARVYRYR